MRHLLGGLSVSASPEKRLLRQVHNTAYAYCCQAVSLPAIMCPCLHYCFLLSAADVHCYACAQENAESKVQSQSRLHTFTRQLRRAILHNADVASVWRPAARMLDVKATLDKKLNDRSFACASPRVTGCLAPHLHVCSVCNACARNLFC